MGSCVSRAPPASAGSVATAAKVIDIDGFLVQIAAPVTASEALGTAASARFFLCSSDELRFDAPARALAADEPLQPGWLYFALPLPMLRRPLSGQEMAALAVKATSALATATVASPPRLSKSAVADGGGKRRRKAGRVAPLVVVSSSSSSSYDEKGEIVVGKTRKGAGYRSGARRRTAGVQRLSAIPEASDCE
ncbi:uncharacterized protein LOC100828541 [Brachypodium distachyon]|uniref:Uncharacterized protein n=1 Tax=Brachypodium distachyon TaxID=15368 RepID=I1IRC5_BRADI|nr:uncharacterized protein LOC100828541 [Brachypodium distachyon]KQJ90795.1 hypothetical protein BRADI_4g33970v3 [Brachypodium distachyon]|eukprot:XP_003578342.1 uncharacterized protein LOC100828541 [Brachypodium distachyon]